MCRGAPTLGPLRGSRLGAEPLVSSALDAFAPLQPIHAHPFLQHPSEASAIEDALARAQAEAAMWRASFEKAQKAAQETNERYSELVHGQEVRRPLDVNGGDAGPASEQHQQTGPSGPPTPSEMAWNLSSVFDDSDPVSFKDIAAGLGDLVFPAPSVATSLGPANSEVTSSPLMTLPPVVDECMGPFTSAYPAPLAASGGLSYASEDVLGFRQTASFAKGPMGCTRQILTVPHTRPTWNSMTSVNPTPPIYSTAVSDMTEMLKPHACFRGLNNPFASHHDDASAYGETVPGLQLVTGQTGQGYQHPGVTTVRRTRQPSARSPRNVSSGCSPAATAALEAAADARGRGDKRVTPKREALSPTPSVGGATRRCMSPGCTRRPSYGFIPGAKDGDKGGARWCRAHAADGMEDLRNLKCSHVGRGGVPCRAQPSYGYEGDKRPTRCRAHAEDGMENVRMPRCRHPGCKRQPLYGEPGLDKKPTRCRNHALSGMKDLRGAMCRGDDGSCTKRPSCGFRGDPRPTRCGSHKEPGMEDLISARCNFADCRTVASYGVQAPGSHVIRRTRCKAHRTPEMTCGTKGPACMAPGGCETRPSYGWPDKFDGEHPPRPERCKKHSLQGMEYMGSAARAKKKRALETAKQEPAPVVSRPARPTSARTAAKPLSLAPTPRLRPTRKCAAAAAPIIEPDEDDDMDAVTAPPGDLARAWSPESRMQGSPEAERGRLAEERAAAARRREREEFENLGDLASLQELKEIEDQANDQMWGGNGPSSPELAGMSDFDKDFSSSWGRPESPESGGILDIVDDTLDTACSFGGKGRATY
ncbi:hypothetical protein KFL_001830050 [Klebsormidium nitens]|uniref:Uncharacterized protein n=1 Tax=Klebsormidium nitens TaxID=105231 RepID=A0A1Y1I6C7_KLENI|nr:hypothetical protein KFL_001830050 [Klebsormidium nitens]|eukprot:GAQ84277.1 hypothetical protein KFL_001830050 [Klebsormidium nitens]